MLLCLPSPGSVQPSSAPRRPGAQGELSNRKRKETIIWMSYPACPTVLLSTWLPCVDVTFPSSTSPCCAHDPRRELCPGCVASRTLEWKELCLPCVSALLSWRTVETLGSRSGPAVQATQSEHGRWHGELPRLYVPAVLCLSHNSSTYNRANIHQKLRWQTFRMSKWTYTLNGWDERTWRNKIMAARVFTDFAHKVWDILYAFAFFSSTEQWFTLRLNSFKLNCDWSPHFYWVFLHVYIANCIFTKSKYLGCTLHFWKYSVPSN